MQCVQCNVCVHNTHTHTLSRSLARSFTLSPSLPLPPPLSSAPNVTANSYRAALDKERVGRQSLMGKGVWGGVDEGEIKALLLESDSEISHVTGSAVFLFE
jgi:hypothetical protein